ncbi:hypothetical protein ACQP2K_24125 [Microbispora siamensis]
MLAVYGGMASFMLVIALYVQDGLGRSPLGAGLVFLPMGVAFFATSANAARFTRLLGRRTLTAGALLVVAGEGCLALVTRNAGSGVDLPLYEALMAVAGAGIGMVGAPLLSQALSGVGPGSAGSASGVLSTVQQMAGALGVALIGIVFFGVLGGAGGVAASPMRTAGRSRRAWSASGRRPRPPRCSPCRTGGGAGRPLLPGKPVRDDERTRVTGGGGMGGETGHGTRRELARFLRDRRPGPSTRATGTATSWRGTGRPRSGTRTSDGCRTHAGTCCGGC